MSQSTLASTTRRRPTAGPITRLVYPSRNIPTPHTWIQSSGAILTKPDVLVTSWWVKGVKDVMLQTLGSNGKKSGVIVFGNPFPGNDNIEARARGMQAAIDVWNSANGTSFTLDNFADKSDADARTSSGLYQAKVTQLGTNLVAAAGVATGWPTIVTDILSSKGSKPGQIVLGAFRADPPARKGLHDGWIVASADESLYPAGYVTATLAWQYFQRSIAPRDYATGGSVIDNSNIAAIDQRESVITNLSKQYGVRLS